MSGAMPPLTQYAFMAWCSVKVQDQICLTFYLMGDPNNHGFSHINILEFLTVLSREHVHSRSCILHRKPKQINKINVSYIFIHFSGKYEYDEIN